MKYTGSKYWYRVTIGAIALGLAGSGVCALLIFGTTGDEKKEEVACAKETSAMTAYSDMNVKAGSKYVLTTSVHETSVPVTTTTVSTGVTTTSTTTTTVVATTTMEVAVETTEIIQTEPPEEVWEPVYYNDYITDYEHVLLANCVANEYGSDWVSVYDKACVVSVVMNRVSSSKWPNTIEGVLTQPDQFTGYWACGYYWDKTTQSCKEAVDYYFSHQDEFPYYTGFWGDGTYNHFY
jgi:hypothetical protein